MIVSDRIRASLYFGQVYHSTSFLSTLKGLKRDLSKKYLHCFTLHAYEAPVLVEYVEDDKPKYIIDYGSYLPNEAGYIFDCTHVPDPLPVRGKIEINVTKIKRNLLPIARRISIELGLSKDASLVLIESTILSHEIQHHIVNTVLTFLNYYMNLQLDFVDTWCAIYVSELLVDLTMTDPFIKTLTYLGMNVDSTKALSILELLDSVKSSSMIPISDIDAIKTFLLSHSFEKTIEDLKNIISNDLLDLLYDIKIAWDITFKNRIKMIKMYLPGIMTNDSLVEKLREETLERVLFMFFNKRIGALRELVDVLEKRQEGFIRSVNTSLYRRLDKLCTSVKLMSNTLAYLWESGEYLRILELLKKIGILVKSNHSTKGKKAFYRAATFLQNNQSGVSANFDYADVSVLEELSKARRPTRRFLDLEDILRHVIANCLTRGRIKVASWQINPKEHFNVAVKNKIGIWNRVYEFKKSRSVLIIDGSSVYERSEFDANEFPVIKMLENELKRYFILVNKLRIPEYDYFFTIENIPYSSYVFYFTNDWNIAVTVLASIIGKWNSKPELLVLVGYPRAGWPLTDDLKHLGRYGRNVYFVFLHSYINLRHSWALSHKEALRLVEQRPQREQQ